MASIDVPFVTSGVVGEGGTFSCVLDSDVWTLRMSNDALVFDVWAEVHGDWVVFSRTGDAWVLEEHVTPERLRFWLVEDEDSLEPTPMLETVSEVYVPIVAGEPPLPGERSTSARCSLLVDWQHQQNREPLVAMLLDEWTDTAARAASMGWMSGLPRGDDLLATYVAERTPSSRPADFGTDFAVWLAMEFGLAVRRGASERRHLEQRREPVALLRDAFTRLLRGIASGVEVVHRPPQVIAPRDALSWLVDRRLRRALEPGMRLDEPYRPVFVLRPLLRRGGDVMLAGEVI